METTITTEQKRNDLLVKENWSKPEVNLIGINEDTLGTVQGGADNMSLS
jgi:hypothetical protein